MAKEVALPLDPMGLHRLEGLAHEAQISRLRVALKGPGVSFKDRLFYGRQIAKAEKAWRSIHEVQGAIIGWQASRD